MQNETSAAPSAALQAALVAAALLALYFASFAVCAACRGRTRSACPRLFACYLAWHFWPFVRLRRALKEPLWARRHAREVLHISWRGGTGAGSGGRGGGDGGAAAGAPTCSVALLQHAQEDDALLPRGALRAAAPAGSVRVVIVSDTHGREPWLPDGDVLLHCGDILTEDRGVGAASNGYCGGAGARKLRRFNSWLAGLPHPHKVVIAGNHDATCADLGVDGVRALLPACTYLCDAGVVLPNGLAVYGSPVSVGGTANNAFQEPSHAAAAARVADGLGRWCRAEGAAVDVVMLHGPPPRQLRQRLSSGAVGGVAPSVVCYGHLHNGYGMQPADSGTAFVNAAIVDGAYAALHRPIVVDVSRRVS